MSYKHIKPYPWPLNHYAPLHFFFSVGHFKNLLSLILSPAFGWPITQNRLDNGNGTGLQPFQPANPLRREMERVSLFYYYFVSFRKTGGRTDGLWSGHFPLLLQEQKTRVCTCLSQMQGKGMKWGCCCGNGPVHSSVNPEFLREMNGDFKQMKLIRSEWKI